MKLLSKVRFIFREFTDILGKFAFSVILQRTAMKMSSYDISWD